jgi:hypothetical protein
MCTLCTESDSTDSGLKKRMSERGATGPERAPLAKESAADEAVMRLFILNNEENSERLVDTTWQRRLVFIYHAASSTTPRTCRPFRIHVGHSTTRYRWHAGVELTSEGKACCHAAAQAAACSTQAVAIRTYAILPGHSTTRTKNGVCDASKNASVEVTTGRVRSGMQ